MDRNIQDGRWQTEGFQSRIPFIKEKLFLFEMFYSKIKSSEFMSFKCEISCLSNDYHFVAHKNYPTLKHFQSHHAVFVGAVFVYLQLLGIKSFQSSFGRQRL